MSVDVMTDLKPLMRYCRRLEGANFSLEANTETVPEAGWFYLLHDGKVEMKTTNFPEVMAAYQNLCREFWSGRLESGEVSQRLASAWGILSLDPEHKDAIAVIRTDGDAQDQKRLEQLRRRRRLTQRKPGRFARKGQD